MRRVLGKSAPATLQLGNLPATAQEAEDKCESLQVMLEPGDDPEAEALTPGETPTKVEVDRIRSLQAKRSVSTTTAQRLLKSGDRNCCESLQSENDELGRRSRNSRKRIMSWRKRTKKPRQNSVV